MIELNNYRKGFVPKHPFNDINGEITDHQNRYSQNGEEGVLEKIFGILNITNGVFVNAGCDDIHDHSNVRRLISSHSWNKGLFIEPNTLYLNKGIENIENDTRITNKDEFRYHNSYISVNQDNELISNIISQYYADESVFDLLTLKIDSYEYWALQDFLKSKYHANIILVGYNSSLTKCITSPKNCAPKLGHNSIYDNFYGSSALAIHKLMQSNNYDLVSICKPNNLIYIDKELNKNNHGEKLFEIYDELTPEDYYYEVKKGHGLREHIKEGWIEV